MTSRCTRGNASGAAAGRCRRQQPARSAGFPHLTATGSPEAICPARINMPTREKRGRDLPRHRARGQLAEFRLSPPSGRTHQDRGVETPAFRPGRKRRFTSRNCVRWSWRRMPLLSTRIQSIPGIARLAVIRGPASVASGTCQHSRGGEPVVGPSGPSIRSAKGHLVRQLEHLYAPPRRPALVGRAYLLGEPSTSAKRGTPSSHATRAAFAVKLMA
jgi:hypothetical protein